MTIFAPATRRGLFVDWAFFDGSEISSEFVGGQCASWRFPPKAAVSACSRHSFVEGIRNGGLDFVKAAVSVFRAWRLPAERRLFSFAVVRQIKILNYNSLMVAVIGMLQMRFAGAKGARREVNTSNTSISPIDVKGICHAVPQ